jgi:glyoxylase-like metal-dependent hydrolase (beta-lactamase superfamily II)
MINKMYVGELSTNCYIVSDDSGNAVVFDPGDDAPRIVSALGDLKLRYIILTHGHLDHIAALPDLISHYTDRGGGSKNTKPEIAIHKNDARFLGSEAYKNHCECFAAIAGGDISFVNALFSKMPEPDIILEDGSQIAQFKTFHTPGHSAGSSSFYDEKSGVLISGDTLFAGGVGRSDFPDSSGKDLKNSLKRLLALPAETKVYPGHGGDTTIGRESAYYKFA